MKLMPTVVATLGVVLSVGAAYASFRFDDVLRQQKSVEEARQQTGEISRRIESVTFALDAFLGYYSAAAPVARPDFDHFAESLYANVGTSHPIRSVVQSFGWIGDFSVRDPEAYQRLANGELTSFDSTPQERQALMELVRRDAPLPYFLFRPSGRYNGVNENPTLLILEPVRYRYWDTEADNEESQIAGFVFARVDPYALTYLPDSLSSSAQLASLEPAGSAQRADTESSWIIDVPGDGNGDRIEMFAAFSGQPFSLRFRQNEARPIVSPTSLAIGLCGLLLTALIVVYLVVIERQKWAFRRAQRAAEHASDQKTRFLANMSHEIRTPMSGVLGMAKLIGREPLEERQQHFLENLITSAESLFAILNDILDYSKGDSGRIVLHTQRTNLANMVQNVATQFEAIAAEKGVRMLVDYPPSVSRMFVADPVRLRQILTNLTGNAVKFTANGHVRIKVRQAPDDADPALVRLTFEIEDTGIGIPAEAQEHVFERFMQADASTTKEYGGTGLGLAICKQLVDLMGGEIWLHSEPGKGTTFAFSIAVPQASMQPGTPVGAESAETINPDAGAAANDNTLAGIRVLLVEDDPVNRLFAEEQLADLGCDVTVAVNGAESLPLVRSQTFDLILMDCQMPVMDGFTASRQIAEMKAAGTIADTPVFALTANALQGDREKCLAAGMTDYLTKPLQEQQLRKMFSVFGKRRGEPVAPADTTGTAMQAGPDADDRPAETAPVPVTTAQAPQDTPAELIDDEALASLKSKMKDKYATMLAMYLTDTATYIEEITSSLDRGDVADILRPCHTIKSSSRLLGAVAVQESAAKLEALAKLCESADVSPKQGTEELARLQQKFQETRNYLKDAAA